MFSNAKSTKASASALTNRLLSYNNNSIYRHLINSIYSHLINSIYSQ